MKIRGGFVSNSSSSSFVIGLSNEDLIRILREERKKKLAHLDILIKLEENEEKERICE